jgi:Ca2+-binding RTX toxin-like protein
MPIEQLELRCLLTIQLTGSTLEVTSGGGDDRVAVYLSANGSQVIVEENETVEQFNRSAVRSIRIDAGAGRDIVRISNALRVPAMINGGDGNDVLRGGGGADQLFGQGGNDLLDGGKRGDVFSGGEGKDTTDYSGRVSSIFARPDGLVNDGGAAEGDHILSDIETLVGGAGNDELIGSGRSNRIIGNGGEDSLAGGSGHDTIFGNDGPDRIQGNLGNDSAVGGAGDDTFQSSTVVDGTDTFSGGEGRDTISYSGRRTGVNIGIPADTTPGAAVEDITDATVEVYSGGQGPDVVVVNNNVPGASWRIFGSGGRDTLRSLAGDNLLVGDLSVAPATGGDDTLINFTGASTLVGGRGNDTLITNDSADALLVGEIGDDLFRAIDSIRTEIRGNAGTDTLDCSFISSGGAFVTLDDVADDRISTIEVVGSAQSNVHSDIESVIGSQGQDTIEGN